MEEEEDEQVRCRLAMLLLDCVDEKSVDGGEDSELSQCFVVCCRTKVGRIPEPIEAADKLLLESVGIPVNASPSFVVLVE